MDRTSDQPFKAEADAALVRAARERTKLPAIFLLIVGGLNLLLSGGLAVLGQQVVGMTDATRQAFVLEGWAKLQEEHRARFRQLNAGAGDAGTGTVGDQLVFTGREVEVGDLFNRMIGGMGEPLVNYGLGGLAASAVALFAGVQMLRLRTHGACVLAALLTALLGLAPSGLALFGYALGGWDAVEQLTHLFPSCCCGVGGFGGGLIAVWATVALLGADVRQAFAVRAQASAGERGA